jgi:glutamate synthase (NADPH/NADH) small chain
MTGGMQGFIKKDKELPSKRAAEERRSDFGEIYGEFTAPQAAPQADRCAQCGVPFCQVHCPLQNNIPDWLRLTAQGRLEEAYAVSSATNTFPEICGRICPQDRLCEGSCVIEQSGHGTVTIGAIEKYITETAFENDWVKPRIPDNELPWSAGIIGAGPGGLAAAEMLRAQGYQVTVYDRYDRIGGLMVYGIPNFKLDKDIVERRAEQLKEQGIQFKLNYDVKDVAELQGRHDAVLIATGVYKARGLRMRGAELEGVVPAMAYLTASNKKGLGDNVPAFDSGALNATGKNVVEIGRASCRERV